HGEEGGPKTELLADQVRQPFAGDRTHAGRHFLNNDQGNRDWNKGPKQCVPELCAGLRISEYPTGVVIDVSGDKARSENGQEGEQAKLYRPQGHAPAFLFAGSSRCRFCRGYLIHFETRATWSRGQAPSLPACQKLLEYPSQT